MKRVKRVCGYVVYIGLFVFSNNTIAFAKEGKEGGSVAPSSSGPVAVIREFQWADHRKLSWDDFKGAVEAITDESAAATHCGIGFKTNVVGSGKPEVEVYNRFYPSRSWVKSDARIASVLDHEQGHFDLCEMYTRKLRTRFNEFNFVTANLRQSLMDVYTKLDKEYEDMQQAYEQETVHGTNIAAQKKWQQMIENSLQN